MTIEKDAVAHNPTHLPRRTAARCSAVHVVPGLLSELLRGGETVLGGHGVAHLELEGAVRGLVWLARHPS